LVLERLCKLRMAAEFNKPDGITPLPATVWEFHTLPARGARSGDFVERGLGDDGGRQKPEVVEQRLLISDN
jgi:hypothetical protein